MTSETKLFVFVAVLPNIKYALSIRRFCFARGPAITRKVWCTPGSDRFVLNVTFLRRYSSRSGTDVGHGQLVSVYIINEQFRIVILEEFSPPTRVSV